MMIKIRDWVEALRSGDYEQTNGQLKRVDPFAGETSYCCLGVLCSLYDDEQWDGNMYFYNGHNSTLVLPLPMAAMLNKASYTNWIDRIPTRAQERVDGEKTIHSLLSYINDEGFTFEEIADVIEAACDLEAVIE